MEIYQKPLPVGKTGNYTITVSPRWLGEEVITGFTVTVDSGVTKSLETFDNNILQTYLTGVTEGLHKIHFEWTTATRSDCSTVAVRVVSC